jgi:hypothetical protein
VKQVPLPASTGAHDEYVRRPEHPEKGPKPPTTIVGLDLFEKPIPVPEPSGPEHPLVAQTRLALAGSVVHEGGILRPQEQEVLDLRIFEPSLGRALRIMTALILALERAGFAVEAPAAGGTGHPSRANRTHAVIEGERIPFSIAETIQKVERPPNDQERADMRRNSWKRGPFFAYVPTGKLSLQIHGDWSCGRHRRTWSDGKNRRLEDCLYSVVRGLLISADALKRQHSGT